jgi:hypothetical protein
MPYDSKTMSEAIGTLVSIQWRQQSPCYDVGEPPTVYFEVKNVKMVYGVLRYEVSPLGGHGSMWVNVDTIDKFFHDGENYIKMIELPGFKKLSDAEEASNAR